MMPKKKYSVDIFFFLLLSCLLASAVIIPPAIRIPIPKIRNSFVNFTQVAYNNNNNNNNLASFIVTNYNFSVVAPNIKHHHYMLQKTSVTSKQFHCNIVSTNGGPFNSDGTDSGPIVIQGKERQRQHNHQQYNTKFVGFGTTIDNEWIIGTYNQLTNDTINGNNKIWSFVTGFHWLVYNSTSVVNNNNNHNYDDDDKSKIKTARTAIGLDQDNNLLLLVVDGCEKLYYGMTLDDLAMYMIQNGARYAINLDGGGSSTMVLYDHDDDNVDNDNVDNDAWKVVNHPTCLDIPFIHCERPVASVICISDWRQPISSSSSTTQKEEEEEEERG